MTTKPWKERKFWCKIGFHSWCRQGGYDDFYFCNYCNVRKEIWE